ncbi:GIY-YIG nuclease family protein [Thaumasiovibrio sp. DFM-14]|uniref:GIY-YIG nuclease family protein n=1 Tax=Thaumasiovibrio sp. DFM-14 TaxID=3384792 RepID=UPI00399FF9F1
MTEVVIKESPPTWWVYFIATNTNTLYCGITNDVSRRFHQHQQGKGAKYLRGKQPLSLKWTLEVPNKQIAGRVEYRLKRLNRKTKCQIIATIGSYEQLIQTFPDWITN